MLKDFEINKTETFSRKVEKRQEGNVLLNEFLVTKGM